METETLKNADGSYNLFFRGRLVIEAQALGVVEEVAYFLENSKAWNSSEACEVAESIRKAA